MKTYIDCIPCFVGHGVHMAKLVSSDDARISSMVSEILSELIAHDRQDPPPLMARKINAIVRRLCPDKDLYEEAKDKSTQFAVELLKSVEPEIRARKDSFDTIVRLAIAGNIIDFGIDHSFKLESARDKIVEAFHAEIDEAAVSSLRVAMEKAKDILYITDNCGEAVFDRLLIEPYRSKITLAVRGEPILNDVTKRELASSGLAGLTLKTIDTGDFTPGVSFKHSSKEFLDAFNSASLVVAKGQGNYETLSDTKRPIFFLFRAKCAVVIKHLGGAKLNSFQVRGQNIPASLR